METLFGVMKIVTIGRNKDRITRMLGTGFLLTSDGKIVTTRHVVGDSDENLVVIVDSIQSVFGYQDTTNTNHQCIAAKIVASDPFRDLAILKVDIEAPDIKTNSSSFDYIMVRDEVAIIGYPHCVEGRRVLTFQKTEVGAKILMQSGGIKSKYAVINTQARPGQSGSPILSKDGDKLLGILIGAFAPSSGISLGGINPRELHQTTHCISAEYLNGML